MFSAFDRARTERDTAERRAYNLFALAMMAGFWCVVGVLVMIFLAIKFFVFDRESNYKFDLFATVLFGTVSWFAYKLSKEEERRRKSRAESVERLEKLIKAQTGVDPSSPFNY